ncbi:hypothetical protein BKA63DRAFT_414735, partial [Paraphoma chrysanthemicola]
YKLYNKNKKDVSIINKKLIETFYSIVLANSIDKDIFTTLATNNYVNYLPTYLISYKFNSLRDNTYIIEAALKKEGVLTRHNYYKELPYYF